jgi:hypothetical protein
MTARVPRPKASTIALAALVAGLILATWPAWRVLLLGANPTLEELRQLVCSSRR